MTSPPLLPAAKLGDVLRGRAPLVGSRLHPQAPRGFVSPVEARIAMGLSYGDLAADELRELERRRAGPRWRDATVVTRALLARVAATTPVARPAKRPKIVAARVDNLTVAEALEVLVERPPSRRARMVAFVHAHALNHARFDPGYAHLLARCDLVLADGIGIRIASKLLGTPLVHNINGTDLLPLLCEAAAARRLPLALIGGADNVAARCAEALTQATPALPIALTSHGYLRPEASQRLAGRIARMGRCIVLVGMGSPLQERWAFEHLRDVAGATVVTVGGLFDFYSGRIPRAPMVWRELGLEWAYRLSQEPSRMFTRYVLGNPLFLSLAVAQRLSQSRTTMRRG